MFVSLVVSHLRVESQTWSWSVLCSLAVVSLFSSTFSLVQQMDHIHHRGDHHQTTTAAHWTSKPYGHRQNMVAAASFFLLCLSASSYHCRHGSTDDGRRHATPLFGVNSSSSSRSSGRRREEQKKSIISAQSAGIEKQIDDGRNILKLDVRQLHWEERYLLLKRFQEREGNCNVPQSRKEDGINLGRWVDTQRQFKKKGNLDPERQQILEEIGFEWATLATWEESFAMLKQFKKRKGHCNVPQSHKEDGAPLGAWVNNQRQFKKKGKLDPERQNILEEIGLEWEVISVTWEERFALLKQFMKREGHCNVSTSHKEDGATLGTWVKDQRQLKRKEKLDPERQKILEEIGFEWVTSPTWDEMHALLKQFKKREGHCNVPASHTENGANLGRWVVNRRQSKKTGKLDADRQKILEEIGIEWVLREKRANVGKIFSRKLASNGR